MLLGLSAVYTRLLVYHQSTHNHKKLLFNVKSFYVDSLYVESANVKSFNVKSFNIENQ